MESRIRLALLIAIACACSKAPATPQQVPLAQLPSVDPQAVLAHTRVLSSDEYEGRGPGPGNADGTYIQKVPLVGITPAAAPLVFQKGSQRRTREWKDDVVAWTKHVADSASLDRSELVFVGYGIVAPEYNWDDYKGRDVKGKTLVMLVND